MGAITTTTFGEPIGYPNQQYIDRENYDGDLWFAKRVSQTQVDIYKSSNNGASWTASGATFTRANLQEISGMFVDGAGHIHMAYRVFEGGYDVIYYRRLPVNTTTWSAEFAAWGTSAATAGEAYTGLDLIATRLGTITYVFIAIGAKTGVVGGVYLRALTVSSSGTIQNRQSLISGTSLWLNGPPGIVHPTILLEHTGDGKNSNGSPSIWIIYGRSTIYAARYTWSSGPVWQAPSAPQSMVSSLSPSQPSNSATYDSHGKRCLIPFPLSTVVRIVERNVDNTSSAQRDTPVHPAGVVKHCTISVSSATSNMRIYAVGTSNNKLYYVDYVRDNDTWGTWAQVSASDIIGATYTNYSVRRINFGNGHYDSVVTTGTSPYNLISTSDTAASSPKTPPINTPPNGVAQDVGTGLLITWSFVDEDPSDGQDAYALRRTIGASTTYWNSAGSSWDASEVYNPSGTSGVTLSTGWGSDSDASHFYAVRVKDQQGNSSPYSAQVRVIPSSKDNPTITSPSTSPTDAQITVSWTVATQTAYRIVLTKSGVVIRDTGWVTSTLTSVILSDTLLAQPYVVTVQTRNDEGLTSNIATKSFTPAYTSPAAAVLNVSAFNSLGVIRKSLVNPDPTQPQPLIATNVIYRRQIGDTGNGVKIATVASSTPINLLAPFYSGFEAINSSDNWGTANGTVSTAARSTVEYKNGGASFLQTAVNGTGFAGVNFGPLNQFAAAPGNTFFVSFWFKVPGVVLADGIQVRGAVGWRTAANTSNGTPSSGTLMTASGGWQLYTMTSTAAPANTAFAFPSLAQSPTANVAGDKLYVDDAVFYQTGAVATPSTYDDFTAASGVAYEYSVVSTGINGAVTQSDWVS